MDKYTSAESKELLLKIAGGIAEHLPGWVAGNHNDNIYLSNGQHTGSPWNNNNNGMNISLNFDNTWNPKRINLYGWMPRLPDGRTYTFSSYDKFAEPYKHDISVAWDKAPAKIAKDIERRLLPGYTALYDEAKRRLDASEAHRLAKNERITKVCELLNVEPRPDWLKEGSYPEIGRYQDNIDVKVNYSDYELKIDGIKNIETLERIVDFIKRNRNCHNEVPE